jgi:hypothetical protein
VSTRCNHQSGEEPVEWVCEDLPGHSGGHRPYLTNENIDTVLGAANMDEAMLALAVMFDAKVTTNKPYLRDGLEDQPVYTMAEFAGVVRSMFLTFDPVHVMLRVELDKLDRTYRRKAAVVARVYRWYETTGNEMGKVTRERLIRLGAEAYRINLISVELRKKLTSVLPVATL